jgi:penicillin-binding protein 1B
VEDFGVPDGVVSTQIDPLSGQLATGACPNPRTEYYLVGTQPAQFCHLHGGGGTQIAGWETEAPPSTGNAVLGSKPAGGSFQPAPATQVRPIVVASGTQPDPNQPPDPNKDASKKKKGLLDRLKSIFK